MSKGRRRSGSRRASAPPASSGRAELVAPGGAPAATAVLEPVATLQPPAPLPAPATAEETAATGLARADALLAGVFTLAGLLLYFWRLSWPRRFSGDEYFHADTSVQLAHGNRNAYLWYTSSAFHNYEWTHPALAKLITQAGIHVLGDGSLGFRSASAVFGAAGIGILFVLGCLMFNRRVAVLAAVLLLLDGLWFVQSRMSLSDIFLSTFLLLAYLAFFAYLRRPAGEQRTYLWLTGLAVGLAFAAKWSGAYAGAAIGAVALIRETRACRGGSLAVWVRSLAVLAGAFVLVPLAIYVASYRQFFSMGHSWGQFVELQRQMYRSDIPFRTPNPESSTWWTWPLLLTPLRWFSGDAGTKWEEIFAFGNPAIWWVFLPALAFGGWEWFRARWKPLGMAVVLLGFLAEWLPWAFVSRSTFIYYLLPSVPLGCLAIAWALEILRAPRRLLVGYALVVLAAFIYFYPVYSALPIPRPLAQHYTWMTRGI